ncbi:hypothetical protein BJY52DRAFT_1225943 [Lactarius psammicola]|nr:hypothetical protein BJY52DRAFT_1225943 [Lactarius psammicola]
MRSRLFYLLLLRQTSVWIIECALRPMLPQSAPRPRLILLVTLEQFLCRHSSRTFDSSPSPNTRAAGSARGELEVLQAEAEVLDEHVLLAHRIGHVALPGYHLSKAHAVVTGGRVYNVDYGQSIGSSGNTREANYCR